MEENTIIEQFRQILQNKPLKPAKIEYPISLTKQFGLFTDLLQETDGILFFTDD